MNISQLYEKNIPQHEKQALSLCSILADKIGIKIYLVGGIVRDILLNRKYNDVDILVEDDALLFTEFLEKTYPHNIEVLARNEQFKTSRVKFIIGLKSFEADIASTRSEVYEYPSALPILEDTAVELKKDIQRRDFTINSLAMSLNSKDFGEIYDETENGLDDIEAGLIRILHDDSFSNDPSRIVRGLKYRAKLNFTLEKNTKIIQDECLSSGKYDNDCQDRIKKEAIETLNLLEPVAFDKFISENIYRLLISATSKKDIPSGNFLCEILGSDLNYISKENIWLIFICIIFGFAPNELAQENIKKLSLTKKEQNIYDDFVTLREKINYLDGVEERYDIYKFLNMYEPEAIIANLCIIKSAEIIEKINLYIHKLRHIKLSVSGDDIKPFGIENGIIYKTILNKTLKEKMNKSLNNIEEKNFLKKLCLDIKN